MLPNLQPAMSQPENQPEEPPRMEMKVRLEENLINSSLHYMGIKSKAWNDPNKAFTHLTVTFMKDQWHNGNQIASNANHFFKEAPFTADQIKKYCEELAELSILYRKVSKGKVKYRMSQLGYSMLVDDRILGTLFKMFEEKQQENQANMNSTPPSNDATTAPVSTDLIVNYGIDAAPTDNVSEESPEKANEDKETKKD